jgi:N-acetylmuramoyl-L-alanine amidase
LALIAVLSQGVPLSDLPELISKITRNEKISESIQLAANIQSALSQRLQRVSQHETDRGMKWAPFIVLTGANMPAVLSEIVSNASYETLLLRSAQRQRVTGRLYRGITAYLDSLHGLPEQTERYSALKDRVGVLRVNAGGHRVYVSRESKLNFRRR